jgi:PhnB protein
MNGSAELGVLAGEHQGGVQDPDFGTRSVYHEWLLGRQIEQVTPEEMQRRFTELTK